MRGENFLSARQCERPGMFKHPREIYLAVCCWQLIEKTRRLMVGHYVRMRRNWLETRYVCPKRRGC